MTTNNRNTRQVVIAGAGPVGCVTALILARADVSVTILEAGEDLVPGLSIDVSPTTRYVDELGVTPQLVAQIDYA